VEVMWMSRTVPHLLVLALTFATGMFVLVVIAAIVFQRGLGNGYGANLLSLWGFALWDRYADNLAIPLAGVAGALAIGIITAILLHWRVGDPAGGDGPSIQLPTTALPPLYTPAPPAIALVRLIP